MEYTVTYTFTRNDNTTHTHKNYYSTAESARKGYEDCAMILIELAKKKDIKDFSISRSQNTGR